LGVYKLLISSSFYAVTKSTDIYPATVGAYSIRIENNTALLRSYSGVGLAVTGAFVNPHPVFQLTGHPNSFTGYYKYAPLNGDTMCIGVALYLNGNIVASAMLSTKASVSEQTSENTTFSLYPNPASDIVTLNIGNTNNADLSLNIYNVIGNLVKSEMLKQNNRQISIGDLSNGVYLVTIKSKDFTENQRLIIQK